MGCRMQLNLIWLRVRVSGSQRHTTRPLPGGQCPDVTNTHEVKCESVIRLLTSISICPSFCALKCPFLSTRGLSMKPALLAIYSRGSRKYNKKNYRSNTSTKATPFSSKLCQKKNRPLPSCCEPHYENEAKCKAISSVCIGMKFDFNNKSFLHSLTFIMRFKATRKWPVNK